MSDKSTLFREAMQATLIGMSSAANTQQVLPAQAATADLETAGHASHGILSGAAPQAASAAQSPLMPETGATDNDDGPRGATEAHSFAGDPSAPAHAEQFEIHTTTTTAYDGSAAFSSVDADLRMVVVPHHAAAQSAAAAENPVPTGVAVHAHWHAEIADINSPAVSFSAPVVSHAATVQIATAPAAVDTMAAASPAEAAISLASLDNGDHITSSVPAGWAGVPAHEVLDALGGSGTSVTGAGIKVGVLSDSFNDLGGAAADEADGALPSAGSVQILEDISSGGTDEGRAMMQIVHDIAPSASLAFYTAFNSEQDFANGILALAAAGCKVICDDVSYYDEPFFQNGVVAQAIQTVEAEGVTYIAAAGNDASAAYQAAWTPISGSFDGVSLTDAENFGGSIVQTMNGAGGVPLLLEWNQAYGHATSDLELLVFHNGSLVATETNRSVGESTNPWTMYQFSASGTYQIAIENLSGSNPGLIKEIAAGDGLTANISGANAGTVYGHAMTPGVIAAGAVDSAVTPGLGYGTLASESFSSSGAGTELLFANNGAALSSPLMLSPVTVSGIDDISTTVSGGLHDFYGTSAASASLAGVAALILAANPALTPAQVAEIMQDTAVSMSNSAVAGAGLVQVNAAIAEAMSLAGTVIEADGATKLVQVGNNYYLDSIATQIGPELKYGGSPVYAGEFSTWSIVGTEAVGGGYEVAWANATLGKDQIWNVDSNGNYTSVLLAAAPNSAALESYETTFHQDLNGDGIIGVPSSAVVESAGSTSLVEVGTNYHLNPVGGGSGPTLQYGGSPVYAGEFSTWSIVGAEAVGGGYEVAWANATLGKDQIWSVDSNGTYTSVLLAAAPNSAALESYETTFHQDLNGDGIIGVAPGAHSVASVQSSTHASGDASFDAYTLTPASSSTSEGHIGGIGTEAADQIDLDGIAYATLQTSFDSAADKLAVTDGTATAQLQFVGAYTQDSFHFADDGHGGTLVAATAPASPPAGSGQTELFSSGPHDTFVFSANFGQTNIANFNPSTDSIAFSKSVFASQDAVAAAIHNDAAGNAVITDAAHDMITLQHVTAAQLLAHLTDFHIV